ncbi:hypothetical protein RJG79_07190 [Mycoplasmatota bacterium WC44]
MKCIRCGSDNIAPSKLMYECKDCGCSWNPECHSEEELKEEKKTTD